jgi:hypothetical protein
MDAKFFDSIFEGDSVNGVKLGMGLTNGDFWPRPNGCQNLYCGGSFYTIDFYSILTVIDIGEELIEISGFDPEPCETYFYVLRRVNCCGEEEQSLIAAVKVEFDSLGNLIEPCCNNILSVGAEQFEGPRVRLIWYYCPIDQQAECSSFNLYWDGGSGEIDFDTAICAKDCAGPRLYYYETGVLTESKYIFCVQAMSKTAVTNGLSGRTEIQVRDLIPDSIDILLTEVF